MILDITFTFGCLTLLYTYSTVISYRYLFIYLFILFVCCLFAYVILFFILNIYDVVNIVKIALLQQKTFLLFLFLCLGDLYIDFLKFAYFGSKKYESSFLYAQEKKKTAISKVNKRFFRGNMGFILQFRKK